MIVNDVRGSAVESAAVGAEGTTEAAQPTVAPMAPCPVAAEEIKADAAAASRAAEKLLLEGTQAVLDRAIQGIESGSVWFNVCFPVCVNIHRVGHQNVFWHDATRNCTPRHHPRFHPEAGSFLVQPGPFS